MKIATLLNYAGDYLAAADEVAELEKAGLDVVLVPEPYGFDAATMMGFLSARTQRVQIASGILPIYSRTPTLLAMTAAGLDALSSGRAILGIGASGPQVIEGWHGVPYDAPLQRMQEIISVCRTVWRREPVQHAGAKYQIPLGAGQGTGLGKPLKLINRPHRDTIPILIAALGAKSVEMTAEHADAWLPAFFVPGQSDRYWQSALTKGTANRSSELPPLDVYAGSLVAIGDDVEGLRDLLRPVTALYLGGMGAKGKNFYNELFANYGYRQEAAAIQDLYLSGRKDAAEAAVPDTFLRDSSLVGSAGFVRDQIAAFRAAGVTSLNVTLAGVTLKDRLHTLEQFRNILDQG